MTKTYLVSNRVQFVALLIPKCATRSIIEFFSRGEYLGNWIYDFRIQKKSYIDNLPQYKRYFKFTFVRDPFARVVSCYLNKVVNPPQDFIDKLLKPFGLKPNMPFDDFVYFLCEKPNGQDGVDPHWTSQHCFIPEDIDFIGQLENFQKDWAKLFRLLNIPSRYLIYPKHINYSSKSGSNFSDDNTYLEKPNNVKPVDYMNFYNKETYKMIKERYLEDFELIKLL